MKLRFKPAVVALVVLASLASGALAQSKAKKPLPGARVATEASQARDNLVTATKAYRKSLENLLPFEEANLKTASDNAEKRTELFKQGIVSKREVDDTDRELASAQTKLDDIKNKMAQADAMLAEAEGEDERHSPAIGKYSATAALIRYNGAAAWSLKDAGKVELFFQQKFGQALPISAFGQTEVHDRLGFDHRNAMDVAVQPDSAEGQALIEYLKSQGIPFIAFRRAVAGSATGAHIHIGKPSHRISVTAAGSH